MKTILISVLGKMQFMISLSYCVPLNMQFLRVIQHGT